MKRARVLLAAKIQTAAGVVDVRLRDLSRKGALVELGEALALGDSVLFIRGSTIVPARVAWAGGERAGLEFDRLIDESEVLVHIRRAAAKRTREAFRRPRIVGDGMSEQDRRLARIWAKSVGIPAPQE